MAISLSFVDHAVDATDTTEYTFSGVTLGDAAEDRDILVAVGIRFINGATTPTVTVGGIAASLARGGANVPILGGVWRARVPTGATGDVIVSRNDTNDYCGIAIWRATGLGELFDSEATSGGGGVLDIPSGGVGIGYAFGDNATAVRTWTWTNLTEETSSDETIQGTDPFSSHCAASSTSEGSATRTATPSGTQDDAVMVLTSFSPAVGGQVLGGSLAGAKLMQLGFIG